eukprot:45638-Eustigmatos_ZCMA.PRE.1
MEYHGLICRCVIFAAKRVVGATIAQDASLPHGCVCMRVRVHTCIDATDVQFSFASTQTQKLGERVR